MDPTQRDYRIKTAVRRAYSAASLHPRERHPFPVGGVFARSLGYPAELLATLPAEAVDSFAGVSTVSLFAELHPGMRVLDVGCGAGLDSLIAGRRVKSAGLVVGIDFSHAMLKRAKRAKRIALARNVCFCRADAERLPLETDSIDAVLVNGIFNLNPARTEILTELARVLKPGGALWAAELILRQPLSPDIPASEQDWFA